MPKEPLTEALSARRQGFFIYRNTLIPAYERNTNMTEKELTDIVREAATKMEASHFSVAQKGGYANIVTSSDIAVQEFLCRRLAEALPGSGFLCEEEDMNDTAHDYTWIIDPIDGTCNYSRGIEHCAICVGLMHSGRMEMSAVFIPATDEMFHASRGNGAFLNGRRISVSHRPFADALLCTAMPVYHKEHARECAAIILDAFGECNDFRRFGAAAPELCYLAAGRCELYFEYLLSPWDYAAASLIVEEAGGIITRPDLTPLTLTKPCGVTAANTEANLKRLGEIVARHINQ